MNGRFDVEGIIDRRLLLNLRVDPEIASRVVPAPFRVNTAKGAAIAGVCLLRLTDLRPRGLPGAVGITSESAAVRFAVEWDSDDGDDPGHGVYIVRRDTSSRLSVALGGRAFPGEHHRARFRVHEAGDEYHIALRSSDGANVVELRGHEVRTLPSGSVFADVDEASEFFRRDTLGYSPARRAGEFDGLEMEAAHWHIDALAVEHVRASFFDDRTTFPAGSVEFDERALDAPDADAMARASSNPRFRTRIACDHAGITSIT